MELKILLADDETLARDGLKLLLQNDPEVVEVTEARNGRETVAAIRLHRPDLVLLDIEMPGIDGLGVIQEIGEPQMPPVIFVTAHASYALRAFEINAIDYLLKPVTKERFQTAFQRAKTRLAAGTAAEAARQLRSVLEAIAHPNRPVTRVVIRKGERALFLALEDVERIEAAQNYVELHTGSISHMLHVSMNALEASLDPAVFLRIHRSHIVNIKRIKQVWTSTSSQYLLEMDSGIRLPTGRTYAERIKALISNPF